MESLLSNLTIISRRHKLYYEGYRRKDGRNLKEKIKYLYHTPDVNVWSITFESYLVSLTLVEVSEVIFTFFGGL